MTEKRFTSHEKYIDENGNQKVHAILDNGKYWNNFITQYDADKTCELLNALHELADGNEEQLLAIMTYLHDKYYDIWEEVNKECFNDRE